MDRKTFVIDPQLAHEIAEVYNGNDFLVINKCTSINFHNEGDIAGLHERVKVQFGLEVIFPVHRLDRVTTGLVIFAKNHETASAFGLLFQERKINKFYLAVSDQKPNKKQGWVKGDMKKGRRGAWKLLRTSQNPAVTQFISTALNDEQHPGYRLFLVKPYSGKTHQIRVALKSVSAPIVGDPLYYRSQSTGDEERTYLHAYALRFTLNEQHFEFIVPPTSGRLFLGENCQQQLAQQWANPWVLFDPALAPTFDVSLEKDAVQQENSND
jgi:tRNA pseudouridine32 synthase/23S rRNA pseudouridine746 synthase